MDEALAALDTDLSTVNVAALERVDGAILAAACARVATAALESARRPRSEDALLWARAALHFDGSNEEARWCEARSLDALNRRLAFAIGRYRELAALDTSRFGALARERLETDEAGTVRGRYKMQVKARSKVNSLNEKSPVKDVKGVGKETWKQLPSKGSTPLREAVEHVQTTLQASGQQPITKHKLMFETLELVDEKPEPAQLANGTTNPHVGLLERTLRSLR